MARPLAAASAAWTVAILAALAGVLLPSDRVRVSLALFAFAAGLGLLVAIVLVADGVRHRHARRRAAAAAPQSPLSRLEYLPSVTTGTRRISWHGARYGVMRRPPTERSADADVLHTRREAPRSTTPPKELTGSAAAQRALRG